MASLFNFFGGGGGPLISTFLFLYLNGLGSWLFLETLTN